jgi:putative Holliday junction resolvase
MARLLGLDPGTRRCGVALSDSQQTLAFPREALEVNDGLFQSLQLLIEEEGVIGVVVGRPTSLAGNNTSSTDLADAFFSELLVRFPALAMEQMDERLTTTQAQRGLSSAGISAKEQRRLIDSAAAVVLLQAFIDGRLDA